MVAASKSAAWRALNSFVGADFFIRRANNNPAANAVRLAESIAELEYAIETPEILKRRTEHWL